MKMLLVKLSTRCKFVHTITERHLLSWKQFIHFPVLHTLYIPSTADNPLSTPKQTYAKKSFKGSLPAASFSISALGQFPLL